MPKLKVFTEAFIREYENLRKLKSVIGNKPYQPKQAGADYLMARLNFMVTKYAVKGVIDPIEFAQNNMLDTLSIENSSLSKPDDTLSVGIAAHLSYFENNHFNDKKLQEATENASAKFTELSMQLDKAKTEQDRNKIRMEYMATLANLPRRLTGSRVFQEEIDFYQTQISRERATKTVQYNTELKSLISHLICAEVRNGKSVFPNARELLYNLDMAFSNLRNVDYSKLTMFDNLTDAKGNKYNFYSAAKLSMQIKEFTRIQTDALDYKEFDGLVGSFLDATEKAEKELTEKQLYRFSDLTTRDGVMARYLSSPILTPEYINDSSVGVRIHNYTFANEFEKKATNYLNNEHFTCSSDVRLEHRLGTAAMDFNNLSLHKDTIDDQIAIVKALEIKHSQRNFIWRMFNYIRSGNEINTIIDMKERLIERGVDRAYLARALNESDSEKKLYAVGAHIEKVDENFQKDVKNPYLTVVLQDLYEASVERVVVPNGIPVQNVADAKKVVEPVKVEEAPQKEQIEINEDALNALENGEQLEFEGFESDYDNIIDLNDDFGIDLIVKVDDDKVATTTVNQEAPEMSNKIAEIIDESELDDSSLSNESVLSEDPEDRVLNAIDDSFVLD